MPKPLSGGRRGYFRRCGIPAGSRWTVSAKNFNRLCTLKTDSDWKIVFYSVSAKSEEVVDLYNSTKNAQGIPKMLYTVVSKDPSTFLTNTLTIADIKQQGKWKFDEYSRQMYSIEPVTQTSYEKKL